MITAQSLKERGQVINLVCLGNDLHQRIDEVPALRGHRDGEELPHLRMLDEQVGVEEQRYLVTVHRDTGEAFPQPANVHQARLSPPSTLDRASNCSTNTAASCTRRHRSGDGYLKLDVHSRTDIARETALRAVASWWPRCWADMAAAAPTAEGVSAPPPLPRAA